MDDKTIFEAYSREHDRRLRLGADQAEENVGKAILLTVGLIVAFFVYAMTYE